MKSPHTTDQPIVLRVSRRFEFPPEMVFDAWLDPGMARRFLFATPDGEMRQVDIDPRVGGRFTIVERRPEGEAAHYGEYLEIERPYRLAFSFSTEPDATGDRISIGIVPAGEAGCELTLVHELSPAWAGYETQTRKGWADILATLGTYLQTAT